MVSCREEVAGWFLSLEMELPTHVCAWVDRVGTVCVVVFGLWLSSQPSRL